MTKIRLQNAGFQGTMLKCANKVGSHISMALEEFSARVLVNDTVRFSTAVFFWLLSSWHTVPLISSPAHAEELRAQTTQGLTSLR